MTPPTITVEGSWKGMDECDIGSDIGSVNACLSMMRSHRKIARRHDCLVGKQGVSDIQYNERERRKEKCRRGMRGQAWRFGY